MATSPWKRSMTPKGIMPTPFAKPTMSAVTCSLRQTVWDKKPYTHIGPRGHLEISTNFSHRLHTTFDYDSKRRLRGQTEKGDDAKTQEKVCIPILITPLQYNLTGIRKDLTFLMERD